MLFNMVLVCTLSLSQDVYVTFSSFPHVCNGVASVIVQGCYVAVIRAGPQTEIAFVALVVPIGLQRHRLRT